MEWWKKAQSGAGILVGLLAVMIILYVLFLPPAERAALLNDNQPGATGTQGGQSPVILYTSTGGSVYTTIQAAAPHNLPTVAIRSVQEGSILVQRDSVTVKNNVFEKQPATIVFSVDPSLTKNAILSMNLASRTAGNLIVTLNGDEVYNTEASSRTIPPIALNNLQSSNTLTLIPSSVGFSFWRTNTYTLANLKITADVTDLTGASAQQRFTITPEEFANMDSAQLSFVPVCTTEGRVIIDLNSIELFSGTPDCGSINTLELAATRLQPGENTISFATRDADITVDRAAVTTTSRKRENTIYSFTANSAQVQGHQVVLHVLFPDTVTKRGIIMVNGNSVPLFAQSEFTTSITNFIQPGVNTIQFQATDKDFEVVKFDVLLN